MEAIPISKIEIYNPTSNCSYYVPVEKAKELAKHNPHKWIGCKTLVLGPDRSMKVTWGVRQSGHAGPLVMQVVVTGILLLASISPRFFPGFHHLQNMPTPIWVTVERA